MKYTCTCGRTFRFEYQLKNHIGYAILRDDNADRHAATHPLTTETTQP